MAANLLKDLSECPGKDEKARVKSLICGSPQGEIHSFSQQSWYYPSMIQRAIKKRKLADCTMDDELLFW